MTDREMLEAAAKAAGHSYTKWVDGYSPEDGYYGTIAGLLTIDHDVDGQSGIDYGEASIWNPLADDGDALRLAVRLDLAVGQSKTYAEAQVGGELRSTVFQPWGDDKFYATRRAIVCAAASIGQRN